MKLQNGKFYTNGDGVVVKAQIESDGKFHCYDCEGNEQPASNPETNHVEGWAPVGRAMFEAAKLQLKAAKEKEIAASVKARQKKDKKD